MVSVPSLDEPCGRYLRYRDLVECGKTWEEHAARGAPIDNAPRARDSFAALEALCLAIIDPVREAFGSPVLTYGFAARRLTKQVGARIAPKLDQHAACEVGDSGALICPRRGAAADLYVAGISATELARWVASHTAFDRLYLYGDDRPLHVSHGPENSRVVVEMTERPSGRRTPRVLCW